jgi:hypothetical protein
MKLKTRILQSRGELLLTADNVKSKFRWLAKVVFYLTIVITLWLVQAPEVKAATNCPQGEHPCTNGCTVTARGAKCTTYCTSAPCPLNLTANLGSNGEQVESTCIGNSYTFAKEEFNLDALSDKIVLTPRRRATPSRRESSSSPSS